MNPMRDEDETEMELVKPWRERSPQNDSGNSAKKTPEKKKNIKLARTNSDLSRDQIDRVLENYDFKALHDRIMKAIT